jgi:hypothetical protein
MKVHHSCPVQASINVLSGKWKVQAVWRLSFGPLRFAELRNLLRGVSEKVLTTQLRELEKDGVILQGRLFARATLDVGELARIAWAVLAKNEPYRPPVLADVAAA